MVYSERGEPGTGGQKGDQGKKHIPWIDIYNIVFSLCYQELQVPRVLTVSFY
jgi:hypothetical protein